MEATAPVEKLSPPLLKSHQHHKKSSPPSPIKTCSPQKKKQRQQIKKQGNLYIASENIWTQNRKLRMSITMGKLLCLHFFWEETKL